MSTLIAMLEQALRAKDRLVRLQVLAEAQYQLAWALREAVVDAEEADKTWAQIGQAIHLPRGTAWRQFTAGGPLVVVKPFQSADSSRSGQTGPRSDTAVYAFRAEDGNWFGSVDSSEDDEYGTGWLAFDPPNAPRSRFSGEELLVRYGPWDEEASFHAPMIRDAKTDQMMRVRATHEVIDWLFGDGQVAVRQAMTAVAQARAITPGVNPELAKLIDHAVLAQGLNVPTDSFIKVVGWVAEHAQLGWRAGLQFKDALERLDRAMHQYRVWESRARAVPQ